MFASDGLNYLQDRRSGAYVGSDEAFADLIREQPPGTVARIVAETRAAWRASYRQLLHRIQVPKILLWFSTRRPAYRERFDSVQRLFGSFPQLVDAESVKVITPWADAYVEVVGARGLPQPLVDRFTGATTTVLDPWTRVAWTENWYYPSPAMHAAAAAALEPVCRRLPGAGGAGSEQTARLSGVRRWLGPLVRYPL